MTQILQSEPYTSEQSHEQFSLVQMQWDAVTPDTFWSWIDSRGYGPSVGLDRDRHPTRDAAAAALERHLRIESIKRQSWTREQYEAAVLASDEPDQMRDDRYMEMIVRDNADTWTEFYAFAQARFNGIQAERAAQPATPPTPTARTKQVACPNCGMLVSPMVLMSASLGTACPHCYDEMSS